MSKIFVHRVNVGCKSYDVKFTFKGYASARPIEKLPICPYCNGNGGTDSYGRRMYPDDEPEICKWCFGKGYIPFHVQRPYELDEYLTKCIDKYFEEVAKRPPPYIGENL